MYSVRVEIFQFRQLTVLCLLYHGPSIQNISSCWISFIWKFNILNFWIIPYCSLIVIDHLQYENGEWVCVWVSMWKYMKYMICLLQKMMKSLEKNKETHPKTLCSKNERMWSWCLANSKYSLNFLLQRKKWIVRILLCL